MAVQTSRAPAADGVTLRAMSAPDLAPAHALSADLRWPHRLADWEQAFRHAEGVVAERDGQVVGTALRWRWGERHATIGLVIVAPACRGRRIGHRLMSAVLEGLESHTVLLHATPDGRGLYERLGFARIGELRQHQGMALPAPLVALDAGRRLRPAGTSDLAALTALDSAARGFGLLRRFGRGHVIGPVVAPDANSAKALIAHLSGLNAGRFTRIDIDFDSGLAEWAESLGLLRVDAATAMLRGPALVSAAGEPALVAIVTQSMG